MREPTFIKRRRDTEKNQKERDDEKTKIDKLGALVGSETNKIIAAIDAAGNQLKTASDNGDVRERKKHHRETIALCIAGIVAVVAGLQWCAMHGQQQLMQGQLDEMVKARQATNAQIRAEINREGPFITPYRSDGKPTAKDSPDVAGWYVNPGWKNIGSTDAENFDSSFDFKHFLRGEDSKELKSAKAHCPQPIALNPDATTAITVHHGEGKTELARQLPIENAQQAERGDAFIIIVTNAVYREIFPNTPIHHLYACVLMAVSDTKRGVVSFPILDEKEY
jgi:hypothetical protein